jgi:hypothetical protein
MCSTFVQLKVKSEQISKNFSVIRNTTEKRNTGIQTPQYITRNTYTFRIVNFREISQILVS